MKFEYGGMTYEQASREAQRLIDTRGWFQSFDRLSALRTIMKEQIVLNRAALDRAARERAELAHR